MESTWQPAFAMPLSHKQLQSFPRPAFQSPAFPPLCCPYLREWSECSRVNGQNERDIFPTIAKLSAGTNQYMQETFLEELILARVHVGPVFALAQIQEKAFDELFLKYVFSPLPICIRTFAPSLCMDKMAVFTHPWCQYINIFWDIYFGAHTGKYSRQIIYVLVSRQGAMWDGQDKRAFCRKRQQAGRDETITSEEHVSFTISNSTKSACKYSWGIPLEAGFAPPLKGGFAPQASILAVARNVGAGSTNPSVKTSSVKRLPVNGEKWVWATKAGTSRRVPIVKKNVTVVSDTYRPNALQI